MDSVIARIVELDQQAISIKEKIKDMEKNNNDKLKKVLTDMESKAMEEAKRLGNEKYQVLLDDGNKEKHRILEEAERECARLEKIFKSKYDDLKRDAFDQIFRLK